MLGDRDENDKKTKPQPERIDDNQQWWLRFVPNSKPWSDVNISRFLSIYKTHPILWDPTHSFYKDQSKRTEAYSIISNKLNLYAVKESECIKLVESLKDLYAEEKKRQTIAKRCSQKYAPPPTWYRILEKMIHSVQQKLAEPVGKGSMLVNEESVKPWEICCPRLYTEDIWTPKHFKTSVMDWFLGSQNDQLFCTCQQFSQTTFDDSCSTGTSSTNYGDSTSDSSGEINQCVPGKPFQSSNTCCFNMQKFKVPEQCGVDVDNGEVQTCNDRKRKKNEKRPSFCNSYFVDDIELGGDQEKQGRMEAELETTAQCPTANTKECTARIGSRRSQALCRKDKGINLRRTSVEQTCCEKTAYRNNLPRTDKEYKTKQTKQNCKEKLGLREESAERLIICEERDVSDFCEIKSVESPSDEICSCRKTNTSLSRNRSTSQETRGIKYWDESSHFGCESKFDGQKRCDSQNTDGKFGLVKQLFRPCDTKRSLKPCTAESPTHGNGGSLISSKTTTSSSTVCNPITDLTPASTSQSRSLLSECRILSQKEKSDHRLDYHPDPTLCEKCAVDRVPVQEVHKNVVHSQDPRTPELDKYCRYKDWDAIYNVRTQVPDEDSIFPVDEDFLLVTRHEDEPPRPKRKNHFPTEADMNLFIDPKSSEARQVSLNNEYKREYGLEFEIDQPRHYACEVFDAPSHKPAQLIL